MNQGWRSRYRVHVSEVLLKFVRLITRPMSGYLSGKYPMPALSVVTFATSRLGVGESIRLLFLADLHVGILHGLDYFRSALESISGVEADVLALGGDYVFEATNSELRHLASLLARLKPRLGGYFVLGNHDNQMGKLLVQSALEGVGFVNLSNRGVRLLVRSHNFWLCGVDDMETGEPDFGASISGKGPYELSILLSHHPDFAMTVPRGKVDLILSGHTHGGQIQICNRAWVINANHVASNGCGFAPTSPCPTYVTRGVGSVVVPVRFGAEPEVTLVEIKGLQD